MLKNYAMQSRGAIRVAEPGKTTTAKQQRAIEAFETSLFTRDREAVLNRKLFALRAAEFLCEIIRTGAATAEAIAKAEPERFGLAGVWGELRGDDQSITLKRA